MTVLAVLIMIAVPSVMLSVSDDVHAEVYLEATSGSGTIDDPYSGEVTCNGTWFWNKFNHEIWVEIGTSFDITVRSGAWGGESITVTPGFGLEISTGNSDLLIGTANNVGQCIVTYSDNTEYTLTINIVNIVEQLTFTSDPVTNGILIPPGHHLVTVVSSESGHIENRFVVEHGHILDEVDLPLPTQAPGYYLIHDSSADEYVDGRGYAVTENVTVLHYPHGDPGPGAGGEIVNPEL